MYLDRAKALSDFLGMGFRAAIAIFFSVWIIKRSYDEIVQFDFNPWIALNMALYILAAILLLFMAAMLLFLMHKSSSETAEKVFGNSGFVADFATKMTPFLSFAIALITFLQVEKAFLID